MRKKFAKSVVGLMVAATMLTTNVYPPLEVYAGSVVGQSTFDEGVGLPWHTCQTNPANQSFEIKDGAYTVTINNPGGRDRGGESRWDLQLRHRGIKIESGHTYKVSFKINASNAGEMNVQIADYSGNDEGVAWHNTMDTEKGVDFNQSWSNLQIAKGDNEFEFTFTSDKSLDVAEWAFHYGGAGQYQDKDCFPEGTVLTFDDLKLECLTCDDTSGEGCNWDMTNEMGKVTPRSDVRINQVGYYTNLAKVASYATDEEVAPVSFAVKNSSGATVYEGTGVSQGYDEASGEYVQLLDFTELQTAGKDYYIEVSDTANVQTNQYTKEVYDMYKSQTFDVVNPSDGDVYEGVLANALNYYYQNRSGVAIESQYITSGDKATLAHQAGHATDTAYVQSKWVKSYAGDGSDVDKSYTIDCTGGWYDAGDHGKYVVNGGISVWTLQNMYEMSKLSGTESKWSDGQTMSIPQSYKAGDISYDGTGDPDILDEARVELEWMFKMIVKSNDPYYGSDKAGMVYHKMHDHKWTGLAVHAWDYADTWGTIRIVKPPSTAATLNVAATAAQAARLWKGIDDDFAAECLENAKLTYEAAKANPDVFAPLDQAIGGGAYGDDYVGDDFYWAACELYATTGDETYYNDLKAYKNANDSTGNDKAFSLTTNLGGGENSGSFSSFNWGCTAGLGTLTLYLNSEGKLNDSEKASVESSIVSAADEYIAQENAEGMGIPYRGTTFTDSVNIGDESVTGYEWGSNSFVVNNAMVMAYAYKIKGTNKYMSGVSTALDYVFGRNGLGISYVTGTGDYYTQNPHHRYWSYELDKSFPKAPAGVMSGGAGSGLQDPYVGGLGYTRGNVAPQKCYVDSAEAWSVNEVTINWNAPFAWILSFMQDEAKKAPDAEGNVVEPGDSTTQSSNTTQSSQDDSNTTEGSQGGNNTTEGNQGGNNTTEGNQGGNNTTEGNQGGNNTTEGNQGGNNTTEGNQGGNNTTEGSQGGNNTTEGNQGGNNTTEGNQGGNNTTEGSQGGNNTTEGNQGGNNTTEGNQGGNNTTEGNQGGNNTTEGNQGGNNTTEGNQGGNTTTEANQGNNDNTQNNPGGNTSSQIAVTDVQISQSYVEMQVGESVQLNATVLPSNATDQTISWQTSNPDILTVSRNGQVTAVGSGSATVLAVSNNGKVGVCNITVKDNSQGSVTTTEGNNSDEDTKIAVEKVLLSETKVEMKVGEKKQIIATVLPSNATNKDVTWSCTDIFGLKAEVDSNGVITAKAAGTVSVMATTDNGKFEICTVEIVSDSSSNTGNSGTSTEDNNNTENPQLTTTQNQGSNTTTQNQGSSTTTQNSGNQGNNNTTTQNNNQGTTNIEVQQLLISPSTCDMEVGEQKQLSVTVLPNNATDQKITWTCTDMTGSTATVDANGKVTARAAGTVSVIAQTSNGKYAVSTITIKDTASSNNTTQGNNVATTTQTQNQGSNNTTAQNPNTGDQGSNSTTTQNPSAGNVATTTQAPNNGNAATTTQAPNNSNATTTTQAPNNSDAATTTQAPAGASENPLEPAVQDLGGNTYITNTTIIKGTIIKGSSLKYQITKNDASGKEARVYGLSKNVSTVNVPNMIVINNDVYKVTSIKSKAFYNKSVIKKITLGKNIKSIGTKAFYKCKKVKTVTIKTTKLTTKNVKSNAFGKMKASMTIKVPKAKKAAYKKLLIKRGVSKKAKIK